MNPIISSLQNKGYTLDETFGHNDIIPFILRFLFARNHVTIAFLLLNVSLLLWLIITAVFRISQNEISVGNAVLFAVLGGLSTVLLVPLHEGIHGLAYKIRGASRVIYRANWRKLYFMAIAPDFIVSRGSFYFIGLSPFLLISSGGIFASLYSGAFMQIFWVSLIFVHCTMCAGDFGLMSYFASKQGEDVVTFDDALNEKTYFLSRPFSAG
jgi:hypothetical protein